MVSKTDVIKKKYDFSAGKYFAPKIELTSYTNEEFNGRISVISNELKNLIEESNKCNNNILEQLEHLKYDL